MAMVAAVLPYALVVVAIARKFDAVPVSSPRRDEPIWNLCAGVAFSSQISAGCKPFGGSCAIHGRPLPKLRADVFKGGMLSKGERG
jgi:hypothetical protein